MSVTQKIIEVQAALKAPKGQTNTFGGYKYRSCEDILEAVKPLLAENDLAINISDEMVEVGGRVYVKATATVMDAEGGAIEARGWAREAESKKGMDDSQVTGSTSSYARKYALNGLFAIDDTNDADATNDHGKKAKSKQAQKADDSVIADHKAAIEGAASLPELKAKHAEAVMYARRIKNLLLVQTFTEIKDAKKAELES